MGMETQNIKTWDEKPSILEKENREGNYELGWAGKKSLNYDKYKKRKIGSLEKMTEEKISQVGEEQEKKIGKRNKHQMPTRRDQLRVCTR